MAFTLAEIGRNLMDLTSISLEEFLVSGPNDTIPADPHRFISVRSLYAEHVGSIIADLGSGYAIHQFNDQPGDVLLLHEGVVVGGYIGESIDIDPTHKGQSLSTPIILSAVPHRPLPTHRILSEAGRAALSRAWQVANGQKRCRWPI